MLNTASLSLRGRVKEGVKEGEKRRGREGVTKGGVFW